MGFLSIVIVTVAITAGSIVYALPHHSRSDRSPMDPVFRTLLTNVVPAIVKGHPDIDPRIKNLVDAALPLFQNSRRSENVFPPHGYIPSALPIQRSAERISSDEDRDEEAYSPEAREDDLDYDYDSATDDFDKRSPKSAFPGVGELQISSRGAIRNGLRKLCCKIRASCPAGTSRRSPGIADGIRNLVQGVDDAWERIKSLTREHTQNTCCALKLACPLGPGPTPQP